ncbi:unnamed protein product [Toxocara canis]|uniref:Uncharacterized protein n=1 Tax=Toxocara canis TaxID=6265 RepID=A0A183UX19_TOXCA|nr:unnamed protein product [Toxocara canis]
MTRIRRQILSELINDLVERLQIYIILSALFVAFPILVHVLLLNATLECTRRRRQQLEVQPPPIKLEGLERRKKKKTLVEPSIRISLEIPADSLASGTLENAGVDSTDVFQSRRIARKKPTEKKLGLVTPKNLESPLNEDRRTDTTFTQESSAEQVCTNNGLISLEIKKERKAENEKVPTLDEVLAIKRLKHTPLKKTTKNVQRKDGRREKEGEDSSMWEELHEPQMTQLVSVNEPAVVGDKELTNNREAFKEDSTETTEEAFTSDRTQKPSARSITSTVEQPAKTEKMTSGDATISNRRIDIDTKTTTENSPTTGTTNVDSSENTTTKTSEATIGESATTSGAKKCVPPSRREKVAAESGGSMASRWQQPMEQSTSKVALDLGKTQSSSRRTVQQRRRIFSSQQFESCSVPSKKSQGQNLRADEARRLRVKRTTASAENIQRTQRTQQDTSSSTLRRILTRRDKFSRTDSTEEDSRSRILRLKPKRMPIKVHPDRLKIPGKRTQNSLKNGFTVSEGR